MTLTFGITIAALFLAVAEVINEVADTANKVGTLGMQGLLAFMLLILFFVVWYQEKIRTRDRSARDSEMLARFNTVVAHHEAFAKLAQDERLRHINELHEASSLHHAEIKLANERVLQVTERSIEAMRAMAASADGLREWLKEHTVGVGMRKPS